MLSSPSHKVFHRHLLSAYILHPVLCPTVSLQLPAQVSGCHLFPDVLHRLLQDLLHRRVRHIIMAEENKQQEQDDASTKEQNEAPEMTAPSDNTEKPKLNLEQGVPDNIQYPLAARIKNDARYTNRNNDLSLVNKNNHLTEETFGDILELCVLLPGYSSSNLLAALCTVNKKNVFGGLVAIFFFYFS